MLIIMKSVAICSIRYIIDIERWFVVIQVLFSHKIFDFHKEANGSWELEINEVSVVSVVFPSYQT